VVKAWRAGTELERRDHSDLFTGDKPGRRCKAGDWRGGKKGEDHCVAAGYPFPWVREEEDWLGGSFSKTQLSLKMVFNGGSARDRHRRWGRGGPLERKGINRGTTKG
jgi:hypothetical protein